MAERNYTLSRAKLFFAEFLQGEMPGAFRYVGNTPEFNLTIESENLDHVSSDEGVREVDDSVPLDVTRSGTLIMDDIQLENLALFFFGEMRSIALAAAVGRTQDIVNPQIDQVYVLGVSDADPVGQRNIAVTGIMDAAAVVLPPASYSVDGENGMLTFLATPAAETYTVTYDVTAGTFSQVITGGTPIQGAMRAVQNNPKGRNHLWVMPKVQFSPNGDLPLKGDEWQQIPFTIQVQKPAAAGVAALVINGAPV